MSAPARIHTFFVVKEPETPDRVIGWDTQDLTVGRASENDLTVELADVSRKHSRFAKVDGGCVVANLSNSNGTLVNGREVRTAKLKSRDVVRIGDLEMTFFAVAKNPATLGMPVQYASQLKSFGIPGGTGGDGEATVLGLVADSGSGGEDFEVAPANDFEYDLHAMEEKRSKKEPRDLDLELEEPSLEEVSGPTPRKAWKLEEASDAADILSLQVEVEGLTPELRQSLSALVGKVIRLPELRIRLKPTD